MWWCKRVLVVSIVAAALGACGFQPLYAPSADAVDADVEAALANVRIEPIEDRAGQKLHNNLMDLLNPRGRPKNPRYVLKVRLHESSEGVLTSKESFTTRTHLRIAATFDLSPINSKSAVYSGKESVVSSFNVIRNPFSTAVAEESARTHITREIAHGVHAKLAVFFRSLAKEPPKEEPK